MRLNQIEAVLFEPVGCLAEFPPGPFHEIAVRFFGRRGKASKSGSRSYWHLLTLMEAQRPEESTAIEALEMEAAAAASMYEDVTPALAELKAMGVHLCIASSLSSTAVSRFLTSNGLAEFFSRTFTRDTAGGVKSAPLVQALAATSAEHTIFLTDTAEGIRVAKAAGANPILMMNDPDESQRLAMHNPAGGIVSLHELPDFVRLVRAQNRVA